MSRIAEVFEKLRNSGKKALIPFFTAGDPSSSKIVPIMNTMVKAGCDILEVGIPFSDPMADGPTIQRSSERALKNDVSLENIFDNIGDFRKKNDQTPIVIMGYANPIESLGIEKFVNYSRQTGVDGVLVVDYPPEESKGLSDELRKNNIDSIFLLAPTSSAERVEAVSKLASGYVYYVSLKGVTGSKSIDYNDIKSKLPKIQSVINLPIGVGFGIRDKKTAREVSKISDAIIIGSKIIEEIESSRSCDLETNLFNFLSEIRNEIDLTNR